MKKLLALIIIALTIVLSSCKYPEGPGISFISKKERIANTWKLSKYLENGVDKTSDAKNIFNNYTLVTTKGGDYTLSYKILSTVNYTETGTWTLSADKKNIIFLKTSPNNGEKATYQILKLYEKELWAKNVDGNGKVTEYHLIP